MELEPCPIITHIPAARLESKVLTTQNKLTLMTISWALKALDHRDDKEKPVKDS